MRVRVRGTAAGPWGLILSGRVGDVPDNVGRIMVATKQAEEVGPQPLSAPVPVESWNETATAEPEREIAAAPPTRRRKRDA